jgi:hypothetical protein
VQCKQSDLRRGPSNHTPRVVQVSTAAGNPNPSQPCNSVRFPKEGHALWAVTPNYMCTRMHKRELLPTGHRQHVQAPRLPCHQLYIQPMYWQEPPGSRCPTASASQQASTLLQTSGQYGVLFTVHLLHPDKRKPTALYAPFPQTILMTSHSQLPERCGASTSHVFTHVVDAQPAWTCREQTRPALDTSTSGQHPTTVLHSTALHAQSPTAMHKPETCGR